MGALSPEFRQRLAADALADVAAYFAEVAGYLNHSPASVSRTASRWCVEKVRDLDYGENPQQQAAFYRETTHRTGIARRCRPTAGRSSRPSTICSISTRRTGSRPTSPHQRAASSSRATRPAWRRAIASSTPTRRRSRATRSAPTVQSWRSTARSTARPVRRSPAMPMRPSSRHRSPRQAREILAEKQHLALFAVPAVPVEGLTDYGIARLDFQRIDGGLLVQTRDRSELDRSQLKVVTKRRPTLEELTDLLFAWRAVRHVTSNAVILAHNGALVGVGAGQASRLTAVEIALHKAADRAPLAVLASDAYFPFADAIQLAAERGITAIIQPGGSARDQMAIEVADRHHMAMVFTGQRHYRHCDGNAPRTRNGARHRGGRDRIGTLHGPRRPARCRPRRDRGDAADLRRSRDDRHDRHRRGRTRRGADALHRRAGRHRPARPAGDRHRG